MAEGIGEALGKGFERVLRWIYPGVIFLVLMALSWPNVYDPIVDRHNGWVELIVIGIAGGFTSYLIQTNVFHALVAWATQHYRWEVNLLRLGEDGPECEWLQSLAKFFERYATNISSRWYYKSDSDSFFTYQFSTYHATMITGWLPLIMWLTRNKDASRWEELWQKSEISEGWLFVLGGVMLAAGLFEYLRLTRIDLRGKPAIRPTTNGGKVRE